MPIDISRALKKYGFCILILLIGCTSIQPTKEQYINADYGPYPENYEQRIKDYFSSILRDPYSAQYRFHKPFKSWTRKAPIRGGGIDKFGWTVRVWVNAKNAFGGFTGEKQYIFFFKDGIMQETGYLSSYHEPYFPDPANQLAEKGRVGIVLNKDGYIIDLDEKGPAFTVGMKKGDKLIKVDNQNIQGDDLIKKITGEPKSKVKLTVLRDNKEFTFEIERQIIQ